MDPTDRSHELQVDIVLEELKKGVALHDAVRLAKDVQQAREAVANNDLC